MSSLARALIALAVAGFAVGLVAIAIVLTSDLERELVGANLTVGPLIGWTFMGAGLLAWWRRPDNRVGSLMTMIGFAWFGAAMTVSETPAIFVAGLLVEPLQFILLIHLLLAFPGGRLEGALARGLATTAYFVGVVMQVPVVMTLDPATERDCGCPSNPIQIVDSPAAHEALATTQSVIGAIGTAAIVVLLAQRWRRAQPLQRRVLRPVYATGAVVLLTGSLSLAGDATGVPDGAAEDLIDAVSLLFLAGVPFAFLVGVLRSRLAQSGAMREIVTSGRGRLRDALADALGDPSLELAYWLPERERYVDGDGRSIELPATGSRVATPIEHDGRRVAAIVHDAVLSEQPGLVRAAGDAAALALENERLDAELRARVEELSASRARIVQIGLEERRRIERDLHDGAQQRLVALRLQLRLARDQADKDPAATRAMLDAAGAELDEALAELRELARGIHPAVLADRGLEPALSALAGRAPLPVEVVSAPRERLPAPVEAAAYFVVAEALTNVARSSRATRASVRVERVNGHAVVEGRDDGVGGADPAAGSGLTGLADRLATLDGRLEVASPPGEGTTVRADIPCA